MSAVGRGFIHKLWDDQFGKKVSGGTKSVTRLADWLTAYGMEAMAMSDATGKKGATRMTAIARCPGTKRDQRFIMSKNS